MSLRLRSIRVANFRKFREPLTIDGLKDGLNIVIEPNEAGKSTLLEALRGAFFVRHGTKNQLAQSYAPHGDSVAPRIDLEFNIGDEAWSLSKQFLRSPFLEVRGPAGRSSGDEAEAILQALLGFGRDNSRLGDVAARGTLGLLWVAQAEALEVTAPGPIVRDTVLSALEAEVGTIMGGATFDRVRARVDEQFSNYWTNTGRDGTRLQAQAQARLEAAKAAAEDARRRLDGLERTFSDLEAGRTRLRLLHRDMADSADADARADLLKNLETAKAAAQILATRTAEHASTAARVRSLEDLLDRIEKATSAVTDSRNALVQARANRTDLSEELKEAKRNEVEARAEVKNARVVRQAAQDSLRAGQALVAEQRRRKAVDAAKERHERLKELENSYAAAREVSGRVLSAEAIEELEALDLEVTSAKVALSIGATRIEAVGPCDGITIDGEALEPGERSIAGETKIRLASSAELIIRPPASAVSAASELASALEARKNAFAAAGVPDLAAARARNDAAKAASSEMKAIETQISAITPADEDIDLPAGPAELKLFVANLREDVVQEHPAAPDQTGLEKALDDAESALAKAEGVFQSAAERWQAAAAKDAPLANAEGCAQRDVENALAHLEALERHPDFDGLQASLAKARKDAADASVALAEAQRNAAAHDETEVNRKIQVIDARAKSAFDAKRTLEMDIARLEATIDSEGGNGLADQAADAKEELEAAATALRRTVEEAETLKMLRSILDEARVETSQSFLGPVARRAKRHIARLLPGCELGFSEDLSLDHVIRAGLSEGCDNLSKGTQEQLAVLTRLAFADVLLEQGRPVSLILDDPLVYSDDGRLDLMTEILTEAAERMQVILLTCRERAFRHLDGNKIRLSEPLAAVA
ncbi:MAG TPA: AAA family ATPase [Allosphingosinicella sp.]|jgi:DNA repair exonuclease SbcCD ATPase subunit